MIMELHDDVINSAYGNLLPVLRRLFTAPACRAHCRAHLRRWNVISARPSSPRALRGRGWRYAVNDNILQVNENVEIRSMYSM